MQSLLVAISSVTGLESQGGDPTLLEKSEVLLTLKGLGFLVAGTHTCHSHLTVLLSSRKKIE
jgi:hypothetical protein